MIRPKKDRLISSFSEWFDSVLKKAEVYDYGRYPVKGMGVWLPYGFQIRKKIIEKIRNLLDETNHEEVLFPLLIPDWMLKKEGEHIRGFEDEVYWITHGGLEELDQKLALRPTSETIITYYESLWYQSYRQLPKKLYQIVSMFRYETKATRALIRLREVTTFKEAHTLHENYYDAERQVEEAIEIYKKFFDALKIPYLISKRPDWDKFAGALYTIAFDTLLPDGKTLQIGTVHHLGQSFPKAFNFKIQLKDGSYDHPWQTSYGISDRVLATLIAIHGDDNGLVLPPSVAPLQAVVVPIIPSNKGIKDDINKYAIAITDELNKNGIKAKLDDREDMTPGEKYYYWDSKGVPLRIEIGEREFRKNTATVVRRDTLEKRVVNRERLIEEVKATMEMISQNLYDTAWENMKKKIHRVNTPEEARQLLNKKEGIVEIPWCGREECALKIMDSIDAKSLGTPWPSRKINEEKCPICGRRAITVMRYARQY
ncbi:MAG: proline--tRNA ligase [Caldisphaeraceae archaeon]|nr:proline--tRNA ligase [Caldisphaeraceae archaeon]MEB3692007.1 proline--tRNA ligase [Caldisphaeraceae archaeon]MEB3798593.1 proline--tRNA ligase [Caldisphaeraceae archaeon]